MTRRAKGVQHSPYYFFVIPRDAHNKEDFDGDNSKLGE